MATYHCSVKPVSRSSGGSACASAAYRAGEKIKDERTGELHDYTRKQGVESATIILPEDAPEWAADRSKLWNAAEKSETRKNSTVAREYVLALTGKTPEERRRQAHEFAQRIVDKHGCAVDVCIHEPSREGDQRNYHAHILTTTRRLGKDGFTEKTRELDARATGPAIVTEHREAWAGIVNDSLDREGRSEERVSHLSLIDQGITDREPGFHRGKVATAIERRGEKSDKQLNHERRIAEWRDRPEVIDRLQSAKDEGELERLDQEIIDLSGDIEAAKDKKYYLEEIIGVDPDEEQEITIDHMKSALYVPPPSADVNKGAPVTQTTQVEAGDAERQESIDLTGDIEAAKQEKERQLERAREREREREAAEQKKKALEVKQAREAPKVEPWYVTAALENKEQKAAKREAAMLAAAEKPPETPDGKIVREYHSGRWARVERLKAEARKADKVIVSKLDKAKAKMKKHKAREPEAPRGVFAWTKQSGFEREFGKWQKVDQVLEKRIAKLEKEHDKQEKMATNFMGITIIAAMKQMEKESPGRTKEVNQAEDREQARRVAKWQEKAREQQAGKGKGYDIEIG